MSKLLSAQRIGQAICRQPVIHDARGAVAVTVAIVMVVLFSFAALALDISNAMIARNELQNVADASALAGARQLGVIYQALPPGTPYTTYVLSDPSAVVNAATSVALANQARQVAISLNGADIVIGVWNSGPRTLTSRKSRRDRSAGYGSERRGSQWPSHDLAGRHHGHQ